VKAGNAATTIGAAGLTRAQEASMKVRIHNSARFATLCCGLGILAACAGSRGASLGVEPVRSLSVVTEDQIVESHATTAYEAIERTRPMILISKVDLPATMEREVYLNGVKLGGINELRLIPASSVSEIRFVRAIDSAAFGIGRPGGAILVMSKVGR
jgi:hypothetical protein